MSIGEGVHGRQVAYTPRVRHTVTTLRKGQELWPEWKRITFLQ